MLGLIPAAAVAGAARVKAAEAREFEGIDTHIHIHRDAPALIDSIKASNWRGLDIVVCPASGAESFDLEEKLRATQKVHRESGGTLAWASTFDARGFEQPDFAERTIARLRRSFDDGAIGVKIWKNIGMSIKSKAGAYLLPDDPALLPIYEAIQKADRTLVAHLAEPDGAWLPLDANNPEITYYSANPQWHMFGKPGAPVKEAILTARDRVLARYPDLRVVGCHLGSDEDDLGRLARRLDAYPNFAVDTAARVRYFARGDRDRVRRVPDQVPGPHPLRHRLLPPRGRPGRRGPLAPGNARPRLGLLLRRRRDGVRRPADARAGAPRDRPPEDLPRERAPLAARHRVVSSRRWRRSPPAAWISPGESPRGESGRRGMSGCRSEDDGDG